MAYERNERGEQVVVKSTDSTHRAYLRFTNCTKARINIWWRDFQGARQLYVVLHPGKHFDVNTFLTHPWEFTHYRTNEAYVVNNNPIFRAPASIADMRYRTNWNITIPVRTLRHTALLFVADVVGDEELIDMLELPIDLAEDLRIVISTLNGTINQPIS